MTDWRPAGLSTSDFKDEYSKLNFVTIRQFVPPSVASSWALAHRDLPCAEVCVDDETGVYWLEQYFQNPSDALGGLASDDGFKKFVCDVTGLPSIDERETRAWINRYLPGDYVPLHTDRSGDTQFLLCLQGLPAPDEGGDMYIGERIIKLNTGDAVLFRASGLPHGTTRIGGGQLGETGYSRVTCVIRFFSNNA